MNVRPLFDLLCEVVVIEGSVGSAMPELELGVGSCIALEGLTSTIAPLLGSERLAASLTVVHRELRLIGCETAKGTSSKSCTTFEEVGIGTSEDVHHHSPGRGTDDEDTVCVNTVIGNSVLDDRGNGKGVASPVVSQACIRNDVPAVAVVWSLAVKNEESALVSKLSELSAREIGLEVEREYSARQQ